MGSNYSKVHHSRTLMFAELSNLMAQLDRYGLSQEAISNNVIGKRTKTNMDRTNWYLRQ